MNINGPLDAIAMVITTVFLLAIIWHVIMSIFGHCRCDVGYRHRYQLAGGWRWRCGGCERIISGIYAAAPPWRRKDNEIV